MAVETKLVLQGQGVSPFSWRGMTQSLVQIDEALNAARTVNGALVDMSDASFRKYASTISCDDFASPATDNIWKGMVFDVSCIVELCYKLPEEPEETPGDGAQRTIVSDSIRVVDGYLFYRPKLTMMVMDIQIEKDEFGANVGWSMDLEEV